MVKAMLSREEVVEKSEKGVFSSFSVPLFLLVCIFSLTKLKRPNDENVLFLDIYHIAKFIAAGSINSGLKRSGAALPMEATPLSSVSCQRVSAP
jgi:hypothetical protein